MHLKKYHFEFQEILNFCSDWLEGTPKFQLQTSGTTGRAKSITLTRQQMQASVQLTQKALGLQKGMKSLVCLNTQYIAGLMMLARGLEIGMDMYVVQPGSNPLEIVKKHPILEIDFAAFVPLQLATIIKEANEDSYYWDLLNGMQAILVGGGAIADTLVADLQTIRTPIFHTYAMTETVSHIALRLLNTPKKQPYFKVLPQIICTQDERGCLVVEGEVTNNQKIITNDIVQFVDKDCFVFIGRADNVINSGGIKIQIEALESQILAIFETLGYTNRFLIAPLPDDNLGQKVVLLVEQSGSFMPIDAQNLLQVCKQTLPKYFVPKQIIWVAQFVETPTQKVNRSKTIEQFLKG